MTKNKLGKATLIKFTIFIAILLTLVILATANISWIIEKAKQPEVVREYIRSFSGLGFLIYVLIQAIHVLVVIIPGDLFNICGGYIYGVPVGFLLSFTGLMLGTIMAFYIARIFGYDFISKFIPKDKITQISDILNSSKGMIGMLVICLIPFIPKDLMMYIAGLTPIKASRLFFVYAVSRIPGTLIWTSVGAQAYEENVIGIVITVVGLIVLTAGCAVMQYRYKKKNLKEVD